MSSLKVLIVSLNTYAAPYNDGKLEQIGQRLDSVTAVVGRRPIDRCRPPCAGQCGA